jgi:hypothetical protein
MRAFTIALFSTSTEGSHHVSRIHSAYRLLAAAIALCLAATLAAPAASAQTAPAIHPRFEGYYTAHEGGRVLGPPITGLLPAGGHPAQYFEKGRLEDHRLQIADPAWQLMYGRLTAELMTAAPKLPVNATNLTYAGLAERADPRYRLPATGKPGVQPAEEGMFVPVDPQLASAPGYIVPGYFWEYLTRTDLFPGGWLHDIGLPLTPAFAALTVKQAGEREIMMQAFERAVLTFDPANPPEWQVERGNLGLDAIEAGLVPVPEAPLQAMVSVELGNLRAGPSTQTEVVSQTYARHIVHITDVVLGQSVGGNQVWYRLAPDGAYISATIVQPFTAPAPPRTWEGRWIDVDLTTFYITAYEGDMPLYSAIITAGRKNRTPTGVFPIRWRVEDETMDSATVGIPKGHPEYYYLEHVRYTQYFTDRGHAIHGNYWVHPSNFGRFSSNGCIGLMNKDAAVFWQFATIGTPIHIHF